MFVPLSDLKNKYTYEQRPFASRHRFFVFTLVVFVDRFDCTRLRLLAENDAHVRNLANFLYYFNTTGFIDFKRKLRNYSRTDGHDLRRDDLLTFEMRRVLFLLYA